MKDFKKKIGERIREIRKNKGFSQEEVAKVLGIHRPSVSQTEHGERDLSAEELAKLSEFFGFPMEEIVDQAKSEKSDQASVAKAHEGDTKITFFRHGEATDDLYDQYGGWADPDLSPGGVNKAYLIALDIKRRGFDFQMIYTSPLKRAKQQAEIIGRELKVDVKILQYLKERNTYGLLCGINKKVARKKFPDLVKAYETGKFVLGSEREDDFLARLPLIFQYIKRSGFDDVCCVTHSKVIKAIIKTALKMKPDSLDDGCMLTLGLDKEKIYYIQSEGITFSK